MNTGQAFIQEADAMFDRVLAYMDRAPREFIYLAAEDLVIETPGPGNQDPRTPYLATGRLRGGWNFSTTIAPGGPATNWTDGPYDETGVETLDRIRDQVFSGEFPRMGFLVNNVGYGVLVHEGKGSHEKIGERPWVSLSKGRAPSFKAEAELRANGGI